MSRPLLVFCTLLGMLAPAGAAPVVHAFMVSDHAGHTSLLIPSLHVPALGIVQPSPSVLDDAAALVIEHGLGNTGPVRDDESVGDELAPWAASLTPAQRRRFEERARCAGKSPEESEAALHRAAVQLANQMAYTSCSVTGRLSRDDQLFSAALRRRLPIVELEDDAWVEHQRGKVPAASQEAAFRWILDRDVDQVLQPVVAAFNAGDFDAVARLTAESWGSPESADSSYGPMVAERNARWLETMLPRVLALGGAVVNVGALHLTGPLGLVLQLRERGYRVVPTTVPGVR